MHNTKRPYTSVLVLYPSHPSVFALGLVICTGDTESDIQEINRIEDRKKKKKEYVRVKDFFDPTQRLVGHRTPAEW